MCVLATEIMIGALPTAASHIHSLQLLPTPTVFSLSVPLWVSIHLNLSPQIHLLPSPQYKDGQGSVCTCV